MTFKLPFGFGVREPLPTSLLYGLDGSFPRLSTPSPMGDAYRVGSQVVLVRCAPAQSDWGQIHLLIDDDIESMLVDSGLPSEYRHRLHKAWENSVYSQHRDKIRSILVPSHALEAFYKPSGIPVFRIDPSWPLPGNFPSHDFSVPRLQVAFLGTRSHLPDLELLRDALLNPQRDWVFHHFLGNMTPEWMSGLPHIMAHKPLSWHAYRHRIGLMHFHLCVYPTLKTATNAARSCNKIMEHSMTGAASLFSDSIPFADLVREISPRLLVSDTEWPDKIAELSTNRQLCEQLAKECHRHAFEFSNQAREGQQQAWHAIGNGALPPDSSCP